ncbi:MAG: nuclear transport factor 2 family protein [Acidimicrobiales bacterium]|jgi:hypothetical protein
MGSRVKSNCTLVVERYLERLVAHDWPAVSECLSEDVIRVGPFEDVYTGRDSYVAFLSALMPSLAGYSMRVDRVLQVNTFGDDDSDDGGMTVVLAELTETMEAGGVPFDTAEALVFDVDEDHRIARVDVYIKRKT